MNDELPPTNDPANGPTNDPTTADEHGDLVRELVARCIEALETGGEDAVDRICKEHPESADEVRRRLSGLGELGMLQPPDELPELSEQLGPYRLVEELGHGGMGAVFLAEQLEPVRRKVALKVIKPGMDTREVLARFEAERQALALMNHPNIANVFDAGTTKAGRPYFVMEYVPGVSITEYCDEHRLTTEERLRLLLTVCDAVQHAHQKGIIHRDLKPSNVLVMERDGKAVVKIIDFGVAKATKDRLTDVTMHTEMGRVIGTPEDMSPEQIGHDPLDVDTRTDVFSLGVMLYELLTGTLPFESAQLRRAGLAEMERIICEETPPNPSTRVSTRTQHATAAELARTHGADRRALGRTLRGDLDWITMRALEKDRDRRYQTTGDLSADIERHLRHEPVLARPPSVVYRMRKLVRRYRVQAVAVSAVALSLIAGLVVSLSLYFKAETNAVTAEQTADFLVDLFRYANPGESLGEDIPVGSLLAQGTERIKRELEGQPAVRARLLATFGQVYAWLGEEEKAIECLSEAVTLQSRLASPDDTDVLAWRLCQVDSLAGLGRTAEAEKLIDDVQQRVQRTLGRRHEWTAQCLRHRGALLRYMGRMEEAGATLREALELERIVRSGDDPGLARSIKEIFAYWLIDNKQHERALPLLQEALDMEERLFPNGHPNVVQTLEAKGQCLIDLGAYDEAEKIIERTLAETERIFGREHYSVARVLKESASLQKARGRPKEAEGLLRRAIAIEEGKRNPDRRTLAWCLNDLGTLLIARSEWREAIGFLQRARRSYEQGLQGDHLHVAICLSNLARALYENGSLREAEHRARQSTVMHRRLTPRGSAAKATTLQLLGLILVERNNYDEAARVLQEAQDAGAADRTLGDVHATRTLLYNLRGDGEKGVAEAERGLKLLREANGEAHEGIALLLYNQGWSYDLVGNKDRAIARFGESAAMFRHLRPDGHPKVAFPLNHHGWVLLQDRPADALPFFREAMQIRRRFFRPGHFWWLVSLKNLTLAYVALDDRERAKPLLVELYETTRKTPGAANPATADELTRLIEALERWGESALAAKYRVGRPPPRK